MMGHAAAGPVRITGVGLIRSVNFTTGPTSDRKYTRGQMSTGGTVGDSVGEAVGSIGNSVGEAVGVLLAILSAVGDTVGDSVGAGVGNGPVSLNPPAQRGGGRARDHRLAVSSRGRSHARPRELHACR